MFIVLASLLFPVITEGNKKEIILNYLASFNDNSSVKLIRVNDFPYSLKWQLLSSIYLAWKYFSFDFLIQHTSLANDISQVFNHWVAWTFQFSGEKGMGH